MSAGATVIQADRDRAADYTVECLTPKEGEPCEQVLEVARQLRAGDADDSKLIALLAQHRAAGQAELVEQCALIAEESRDGRLMQKANANANNDKRAARDFESMAIEAGLIAAEIRNRLALSRLSGEVG